MTDLQIGAIDGAAELTTRGLPDKSCPLERRSLIMGS
jgi:hypothetical protein